MAKPKQWIVTLSGDRPIKAVASELTKAGMTVAHVMDEIGSIIGSAGDDAVPRMRKIKGVADVAPDAPIELGPPGADVTW